MEYSLVPRTRTYKPRMDRSGFADKSAEKAAQRQKILEEERALRQEVMGYIRDGKLDLAALDTPVSPAVRTVFLSWVALANLSPDKWGQTQDGQSYTLKKRGDQTCKLRCTDGQFTATIQWSSPNFDYMKVNGTRYDLISAPGADSAFEIPVAAFDTPLPVIADTVAMSEPHEVEYTITFDSASLTKQ